MARVSYSYTVIHQPFISTDPSRRSRFFLSFSMEGKNPLSTSTEEMLLVTNQRYRCPACDKLKLLKSANSVCTSFIANLKIRYQPLGYFLFVYIQRLVSHIKVTNQAPISIPIYRPDLCFPRTAKSQLSEKYQYNEPISQLFRDSYRYFIFDVKFLKKK